MSKILIIGDVMLDHYVWGSADRISPEAPVPVVKVNKETFSLGGAANVAHNLISMGSQATLLGVVGKDKNGEKFNNLLSDCGIINECLEYSIPTTTKTRVISQRHQMIRLDQENKIDNPPLLTKAFLKIINKERFKWIVISDYAKGICSPAFLSVIMDYSRKNSIPVLVDPKENNWEKYAGAFLVKPNMLELSDIIGYKVINNNSAVEEAGKFILNKFDFENLVITRSSKGMSIISKDQVHHLDAYPIDVYDVTGAGDTVLAVIVEQLDKGKSLLDAISTANKAASDVVQKFGVVTYKYNV